MTKNNKLKIMYQIPSLDSVYAARFIYEGYKDAFEKLGYDFKPLTASDDMEETINEFAPNIFITSLNTYTMRFLNLEVLKRIRDKGMIMFNQIRPWEEQTSQFAGSGLKYDKKLLKLIRDGLAGDVFFHWLEQDDPSIVGFKKETGFPFETILVAANTNTYYPVVDPDFSCDISYVGSFLPSKREFINKHVKPLQKKYEVDIYGSDWTISNRLQGYVQKGGQFFNIPYLRSIRKLQLSFEDEKKVYTNSKISLNIHEEHQRQYGSDFNERTLKIIASGGFEICDNVKVLRKYFNESELVIAENTNDWFEKIDFYLKNQKERLKIIQNGRKKVLREHTYINRAKQFINIYNSKKK